MLSLPKRSGKRYGVLVHGNRFITLLVLKKLNLEHEANNYSFLVCGYPWDDAVNEVVEKVVTAVTSFYSEKVLGTLFKNATICKKLADECI